MAIIELTITCRGCGTVCQIYPESANPQLSCEKCQRALDLSINRIPGFIYVLSNPKIPGLLKIGYTERTVEERAEELARHTGVPGRFQIDAYFPSEAPQADEAKVHLLLANHRDSADREFFAVDFLRALKAITEVCGRPPFFIRKSTTLIREANGFRTVLCQHCKRSFSIPTINSSADVLVNCRNCGRRSLVHPNGETTIWWW
jgi:ribosomal protein S27E